MKISKTATVVGALATVAAVTLAMSTTTTVAGVASPARAAGTRPADARAQVVPAYPRLAAATTVDPARDSFIDMLEHAQPVRYGMTDSLGRTMDSAKVIQADSDSAYYAVYSPRSKSVVLAYAPNLYSAWTPLVTLDGDNASQPYLKEQSDHSFVLADEFVYGSAPGKYGTSPGDSSGIEVRHYASLATLRDGEWDNAYLIHVSLSGCHEGTPDIHSIDPANIQIGFHYNSGCLTDQLDQEAFGTLTGFDVPNSTPDWMPTADTAKDSGLNKAGYPGKHGARDDFAWHGHRYSLTEAQNTSETDIYQNWRLALYDYSDRTAHPIELKIPPTCAAVPRVTQATDNVDGKPVLVITSFVYGECSPGDAGEMMHILPAQ